MEFDYDGDPNGTVQRAVLNAAQAASLVRESFPKAVALRYSALGTSRHEGPQLLRLFDIVGQEIWAYTDEHSDQLLYQDEIRARLVDANLALPGICWSQDPDCPRDQCVLDIAGILDEDVELAAERLGAHARDDMGSNVLEVSGSMLALSQLVREVAIEGASKVFDSKDFSPLPDSTVIQLLHDAATWRANIANNEGLTSQGRLLLGELGEIEAWSAIEDILA